MVSFHREQVLGHILCFRMLPESFLIPACLLCVQYEPICRLFCDSVPASVSVLLSVRNWSFWGTGYKGAFWDVLGFTVLAV